MRKEQIAIIALTVWLILIAFFMILARSINFEIFFVLTLLGCLIIAELIGPKYVQPRFMRYIWYLLAAGIAIFSAIVVLKGMEILSQ
jgi:hypothetical protein